MNKWLQSSVLEIDELTLEILKIIDKLSLPELAIVVSITAILAYNNNIELSMVCRDKVYNYINRMIKNNLINDSNYTYELTEYGKQILILNNR